MKALPLARQSSLIVKEVDDETLVYDQESDQAHCLNNTAAQVWKNCDGHTSVTEIAQRLGADAQTTVDENVVWLALDQLEKFKLLDEAPAKPAHLAGMTRRQVVAALGVAALALPAIVSIVSPTASSAASPTPLGSCCTTHAECVSNCCAHDVNNPCATAPGKVCVGFTPSPSGPTCQDLI